MLTTYKCIHNSEGYNFTWQLLHIIDYDNVMMLQYVLNMYEIANTHINVEDG